MMGGDIAVESEPGKGSCFSLRVPAADGPDNAARRTEPRSDGTRNPNIIGARLVSRRRFPPAGWKSGRCDGVRHLQPRRMPPVPKPFPWESRRAPMTPCGSPRKAVISGGSLLRAPEPGLQPRALPRVSPSGRTVPFGLLSSPAATSGGSQRPAPSHCSRFQRRSANRTGSPADRMVRSGSRKAPAIKSEALPPTVSSSNTPSPRPHLFRTALPQPPSTSS